MFESNDEGPSRTGVYPILSEASQTRGVLQCVTRVRGLCNEEKERKLAKGGSDGKRGESARGGNKPPFIQIPVEPGRAEIPLDGPLSLGSRLSFDGVGIGIGIRR